MNEIDYQYKVNGGDSKQKSELIETIIQNKNTLFTLLICVVIGAVMFYLGRYTVQHDTTTILTPSSYKTNVSPTILFSPTIQANPTCFVPPDCSDVIPNGCTRTAPTYNNNGCLVSCGQLQCEPPHQQVTSQQECNVDNDCPKSASCVPNDSCWLYLCKQHACVFTNVSK